MTTLLGARAVRGSLWLGLVNLVSKGSQMVVTIALAAFLTEGGLGAVAIAMALVNIGQTVQAMGVYDVVSRADGRTADPRRVAGTVLTLSMAVALVLAAALAVFADPLAGLLGSPEAGGLVRLAAVSLPFSAIGGVQLALMHRDLDFRRRLLPDAGSAVLGAAVTVVLAATGNGPVAPVLGLVCTAVLQPVLGAVVGVRPRPCWDRRAAREATSWLAVVGPAAVVAILLVNVDYLAVGHVLGPEVLGVYSLAYRIAWVPYVMVAIVLGAVAFPVCVRLVRRGGDVAGAAARFTRATLVVVGGLYLVAALMADHVVLLGQRWAPAAAVLVPLCGYGLGIGLLQTWYQVLKAAGHARQYLVLELTHLGLLVTALVVCTPYGPVAVALAQLGVAWVVVVLAWVALVRRGLAFPLVRMVASVVLTGLVCVGAALALPPVNVVLEGVVLVAVYVLGVLVTQRAAVRELR